MKLKQVTNVDCVAIRASVHEHLSNTNTDYNPEVLHLDVLDNSSDAPGKSTSIIDLIFQSQGVGCKLPEKFITVTEPLP